MVTVQHWPSWFRQHSFPGSAGLDQREKSSAGARRAKHALPWRLRNGKAFDFLFPSREWGRGSFDLAWGERGRRASGYTSATQLGSWGRGAGLRGGVGVRAGKPLCGNSGAGRGGEVGREGPASRGILFLTTSRLFFSRPFALLL